MKKKLRLLFGKGLHSASFFIVRLVIGSGVLFTLVGRSIFQGLEINVWSQNYLRAHIERTQVYLPAPDQHPRAWLWFARDALSQNDPTLAQILVEAMAENGDKDALVILGKALAAEEEYVAAIEAWSQAKDIHALLAAATAAEADGRLDDALLALRAAYGIDIEKETSPLAIFLWDADIDRNEAITLLRSALLQYPYSEQRLLWFRQLGRYLKLQSRWDQAEAIYKDLLEEYPQDWTSYIELGWLYYKRGDGLGTAMSAFRKALALTPERGDGHIAIAQVLVQEERYCETNTSFAQAVELNPQERSWWLEWGNAMRACGNLDLAINIYRQIVVKFPDWPPAYYEMAWAYLLDNSFSKSIEMIEQALTLVVPSSDLYYSRAGYIYELAGEKTKAIIAYRDALNINSLNISAQQGLQRLTP